VEAKVAETLFDQMVAFAEYCLTYETEVLTLEYGPMPVGEIVENRIHCHVYSVDPGGYIYVQHIAQWHNQGQREIFEYTLDDGRTIRATPDHKFMTTDGEMLPIDEIFEKELELFTIQEDDRLWSLDMAS